MGNGTETYGTLYSRPPLYNAVFAAHARAGLGSFSFPPGHHALSNSHHSQDSHRRIRSLQRQTAVHRGRRRLLPAEGWLGLDAQLLVLVFAPPFQCERMESEEQKTNKSSSTHTGKAGVVVSYCYHAKLAPATRGVRGSSTNSFLHKVLGGEDKHQGNTSLVYPRPMPMIQTMLQACSVAPLRYGRYGRYGKSWCWFHASRKCPSRVHINKTS